jgi:hypothetical protein
LIYVVVRHAGWKIPFHYDPIWNGSMANQLSPEPVIDPALLWGQWQFDLGEDL